MLSMFGFGGGMLTGAEIEKQIKKGNINITPYDSTCINPNSYNLKLHPQLLVYARNDHRDNIIPNSFFSNYQNQITEDVKYLDKSGTIAIATESLGTISYTDKINNTSVMSSLNLQPIDMKENNETIEFTIPEEGYVLQPGVLYIGRTVERTATDKFIPMINGRSSGGRLGISIHICAGFGDIGFDGTWTLEITAVEPVRIYPYSEIAQVCYFKPCGSTRKLYKGRYNGQESATASRFYEGKLLDK